MKTNTMRITSVFSMILMASLVFLSSCRDEEPEVTDIVGCMDPAAENYDASATAEGDCEYAIDKFIGNYLGSLECPGLLDGINTDSLVFSVAQTLGGEIHEATISIESLAGSPIDATVDGNDLNVNGAIPNFVYDTGTALGEVTVDLMFVGLLTLDGNTLAGDIELTAVHPILSESGTCGLVGIKQ